MKPCSNLQSYQRAIQAEDREYKILLEKYEKLEKKVKKTLKIMNDAIARCAHNIIAFDRMFKSSMGRRTFGKAEGNIIGYSKFLGGLGVPGPDTPNYNRAVTGSGTKQNPPADKPKKSRLRGLKGFN